jgi:hypothetical protein
VTVVSLRPIRGILKDVGDVAVNYSVALQCPAGTRAEKLMDSNQEFKGFGSVWDWLAESRRPKRPTPPPEPSSEESDPGHRVSDDDLLALEREAEVAARMQSLKR